jgi:hypothetical protein
MSRYAPLFALGIVALGIAYVIYMACTQSFGVRCGKVYKEAALERCIDRMVKGGPLYEENIGRMP